MHSFLKKTLSLFLALSLLAGVAGATTLTGLETETVERSWESSLFFPRMEALTGVSMDAHAVSDEAQYANRIAAMAQGSIPADVLFKANLSRAQEQTLLESGALIDLAPLIEANMPNLSALLAAHPDWKAAICLEDGRIASLPLLNTTERQVCVWINAKWLSALDLSVPTSVAELTDVLLAFKSGDPNGNFKQDEVAADLIGVYEMRWLLPYFGIVADDSNLARLPDGSLAFSPELPAYREWIATLRDWVAQGVLPQTAFTAMHSTAALSSASSDEKTPVTSGLIVTMTPYTHVPPPPRRITTRCSCRTLPAQPAGATCWARCGRAALPSPPPAKTPPPRFAGSMRSMARTARCWPTRALRARITPGTRTAHGRSS